MRLIQFPMPIPRILINFPLPVSCTILLIQRDDPKTIVQFDTGGRQCKYKGHTVGTDWTQCSLDACPAGRFRHVYSRSTSTLNWLGSSLNSTCRVARLAKICCCSSSVCLSCPVLGEHPNPTLRAEPRTERCRRPRAPQSSPCTLIWIIFMSALLPGTIICHSPTMFGLWGHIIKTLTHPHKNGDFWYQ